VGKCALNYLKIALKCDYQARRRAEKKAEEAADDARWEREAREVRPAPRNQIRKSDYKHGKT